MGNVIREVFQLDSGGDLNPCLDPGSVQSISIITLISIICNVGP